MQDWLYGANGYYSSMPTIGKKGDFSTSATVSMFFGGTLGKRVVDLINNNVFSNSVSIIEVGAHHGYLMADMIQFIYTLKPELIKTLSFIIVEPQDSIKDEQQKYLQASFGNEINFTWHKDFSEFKCDEAFIVANELFDAFSCDVVKDGQMLYIKDNLPFFGEISEDVKKICDKYSIKKGEVAKGYEKFINNLSNCVSRAEFITFDYGEIYPRNDISLRIYKENKSYPFFSLTNFVENNEILTIENMYKNSDLTYDVNFSHIFDLMKEARFEQKKYSSQSVALVDFGLISLLDILKNNVNSDKYKQELSKARQLIDPAYLGERFKMARFQKGIK